MSGPSPQSNLHQQVYGPTLPSGPSTPRGFADMNNRSLQAGSSNSNSAALAPSSRGGGKFSWVRRLVARRSHSTRVGGSSSGILGGGGGGGTISTASRSEPVSARITSSVNNNSQARTRGQGSLRERASFPSLLGRRQDQNLQTGQGLVMINTEDDEESTTGSTPTIHAVDSNVGSGSEGNSPSPVSLIHFTSDNEPRHMHHGDEDNEEEEEEDYDSRSSFKRRSNSNFTVPSISRTSITTISPSLISADTASIHTGPLVGTLFLATTTQQQQQHHGTLTTATAATAASSLFTTTSAGATHSLDTASIVTLASSSKHRHRRSFDTNASTRAIAPESIRSRRGSLESLPLTSTATIRSYATSSVSLRRWPGSASSVRSRALSHPGSDEEEDEEGEDDVDNNNGDDHHEHHHVYYEAVGSEHTDSDETSTTNNNNHNHNSANAEALSV